MLSVFILVIGGIFFGVFTPTEGAAVGLAGTFTIFLFRRGFNLRLITSGIQDALRTSAMVFLIILSSMVFARFLTLSGLSAWLGSVVTGVGLGPYVALAAVILVLIIAGCVMPATPMVLLFTPLFYPTIVGTFGLNGIWFGVIVVVMVELAVITPPVLATA
jgi:C4-dicarboxylate transporter DctM subunit